jgi:hypothetical protein
MVNDTLKNVREQLNLSGLKEFDLLHSDQTAQDYWNDLQQLQSQMNQDLFDSAQIIREKYADQLQQLEHEYAMYLAMITPSQGHIT